MKAVKISEDNDALKKTNLSAKVIAHIKAFEEYLVADGKASKTLDSYLFDVKEFMNYLAAQGVTDVSKIKRIHVTDFITTLHAKKLRLSTMNKKINSISCLCKFLKMKSILPETENPVILKEDRVKFSLGSIPLPLPSRETS
ncbi:MAG TPA: site-specific integrase [Desulfosporosinus sp.]